MEKKTILAICDYGTTGIAESLKAPLHHWHKQGHEIWQMALGYHGRPYTVDKAEYPWWERLVPIFPSHPTNDRHGQGVIGEVLKVAKPDFVITAFDAWMVSYLAFPERDPQFPPDVQKLLAHETRKFKHIAYFPLDGGVEGKYPPPGISEVVCAFDIPVTYSKFSQKLVYRDTHIHIPMIPISHDPKVFCPGDKSEARKRVGMPQDRWIVGMVGTNQARKLFGQFIEGVAPLCHRYDDVMIYPLTNWEIKLFGGHEIPDLVWRFGLDKQSINPGPHLGKYTESEMADLYRSFDCLTLLTIGEGCGLPPLRARACGTPVFVSDNTSNTEFSGLDYELIPNSFRYYDPLGSNLERYNSDISVYSDRIIHLYEEDKKAAPGISSLRAEMVAAGIKEMQKYENEKILKMWDALLEEHS